jgi:hypothetical protein
MLKQQTDAQGRVIAGSGGCGKKKSSVCYLNENLSDVSDAFINSSDKIESDPVSRAYS